MTQEKIQAIEQRHLCSYDHHSRPHFQSVSEFDTSILKNNRKIFIALTLQTVALPIVNDNPRFVSSIYLMI
jgi:hypothetical protein